MADSGAEQKIRGVLGYGEFSYEGSRFKIILNEKPYPETKTDFYILAKNLSQNSEKVFKISYKKISHSFIENKIKPHRIKVIFEDDWSKILKDQIFQQNSVEENIYWRKRNPEISLKHSFLDFPVVDFKKKKVMLGYRYELEDLHAQAKITRRFLSGKIEHDIAPQIFWGENCADNMRDAKIDGVTVSNSGIPDFILIQDPDKIHTANDVFKQMQNIKEYAKKHNQMRASFLSQYYYYDTKKTKWKTENWSRTFAVWIKWDVVDGSLRGMPVLDRPLETIAKNERKTLRPENGGKT